MIKMVNTVCNNFSISYLAYDYDNYAITCKGIKYYYNVHCSNTDGSVLY